MLKLDPNTEVKVEVFSLLTRLQIESVTELGQIATLLESASHRNPSETVPHKVAQLVNLTRNPAANTLIQRWVTMVKGMTIAEQERYIDERTVGIALRTLKVQITPPTV